MELFNVEGVFFFLSAAVSSHDCEGCAAESGG